MDQDTFLTTGYVMADDYCKACAMDWPVSPGPAPALSVSEVLTLSLLSRWARFGSDRDFYAYAARHWRAAFPNSPERSHFNRLLRAVVPGLIGFSQFVVRQLQARNCLYEALDTIGCATRNVHRRGRGWLAGEANRGFCNRIGWYDGLNVITSVTPEGVITGFGCAPASTKEQPYAETFLAARAMASSRLAEVGAPALGWYVGDTGFCGQERHQVWNQAYGARVISPPQKTRTAHPWPKAWRRWLAGVRQIVETVGRTAIHGG